MINLDHVLKPDIGPVVLGNMIKLLQILKEIKETFEDWFNGSVVVIVHARLQVGAQPGARVDLPQTERHYQAVHRGGQLA